MSSTARFALTVALAGVLALVATLGTSAEARAAGGLRCGNRLVHEGDRIDEVFRRCGEPAFRTFSIESVSVETAPGLFVTRQVQVETWTVNRGPREFVRYLTFRDGRLIRVDEGDYGY
jgi:hypothetical protein